MSWLPREGATVSIPSLSLRSRKTTPPDVSTLCILPKHRVRSRSARRRIRERPGVILGKASVRSDQNRDLRHNQQPLVVARNRRGDYGATDGARNVHHGMNQHRCRERVVSTADIAQKHAKNRCVDRLKQVSVKYAKEKRLYTVGKPRLMPDARR